MIYYIKYLTFWITTHILNNFCNERNNLNLKDYKYCYVVISFSYFIMLFLVMNLNKLNKQFTNILKTLFYILLIKYIYPNIGCNIRRSK